jgi:hypothetical protein
LLRERKVRASRRIEPRITGSRRNAGDKAFAALKSAKKIKEVQAKMSQAQAMVVKLHAAEAACAGHPDKEAAIREHRARALLLLQKLGEQVDVLQGKMEPLQSYLDPDATGMTMEKLHAAMGTDRAAEVEEGEAGAGRSV